MRHITYTDIIIIILATFFISWLYVHYWTNETSETYAVITFTNINGNDNKKQESLIIPKILEIEGYLGKSIIEIKDNKIRFLKSSCREKICIRRGWLKYSNDFTACLPNRISIHIKSYKNDFDAIAF
jgi:hypothetical protein